MHVLEVVFVGNMDEVFTICFQSMRLLPQNKE